jgi:hypothetical protein
MIRLKRLGDLMRAIALDRNGIGYLQSIDQTNPTPAQNFGKVVITLELPL